MLTFFFTAMLTYAVGYAGWKIIQYLVTLILALFGYGVELDWDDDDDEEDHQ